MFRKVAENTLIIHGHHRLPSEIRSLLQEYLTTNEGYNGWDAEMASDTATLNLAWWSDSVGFAHDCTLHEPEACGLSDVEPVTVASGWRMR